MSSEAGSRAVLQVRDLTKHFPLGSGFGQSNKHFLRAVDGVSLDLFAGETFAVVGESGSGKTTLGRLIIRAIDPTAGAILIPGDGDAWTDISGLKGRGLRSVRPYFQMVFQDPFSSLDPRMTVEEIVQEPLRYTGSLRGTAARQRVEEVLRLVGLQDRHMKVYPHALSGGQRQRVGIARALVGKPQVIVCDEAVSALDVSVQAQVLNLLADLQESFGVSFIFVSHNLAVVEHISDRVGVMYLGRFVETATTGDLFARPMHPYTEALLSAVPVASPSRERARIVLRGEIASPVAPPPGCPFHPRCPYAQPRCAAEVPALREVAPGRKAACHYSESLPLKGAPVGTSHD